MEKNNQYINQINQVNAKIMNLYEQWAKQKGLQYSHFLVLYALIENKRMTQKQIGERCHLIKQTVNAIVSSLQKSGYIFIEVNEDNKREKWISLTKQGSDYAHSIIDELLVIENQVANKVGNENLKILVDVNKQFETEIAKAMKRNLEK